MSTHRITQAEPRRWAMFVILLVGAFLPPLDFLSSMLRCLPSRASWAPLSPPNSWSFHPMRLCMLSPSLPEAAWAIFMAAAGCFPWAYRFLLLHRYCAV